MFRIISLASAVFVLILTVNGRVHAQSTFAEEEFSEDDFAQFFELIVDGKITKEKMSARCQAQTIGFTFAGENIQHEGDEQRIYYNVSREDTSVDGRTLRAKHSNASFGEWTGAVFKPLCPGLYALTVDFTTADGEGLKADEVIVYAYLRRAGEDRPGRRIAAAFKSGSGVRGNGHATISLPLRSGDEISTWSAAGESRQLRQLRQVTLTAFKIVHLENLVAEIDMDAFTAEVTELKKEN
jgi:hypothetical protein